MKRIKYYNFIIEKIINFSPFLISLLAFVCFKILFSKILDVFHLYDIKDSDVLTIFFDVIIFILSSLPSLLSIYKSSTKRIKTFFYRKILSIYLFSHNKYIGFFCNQIINIFFSVKKIEIYEQNEIVETLFKLLNDDKDTSRVAFLTGGAYSGKTTTVQMFLEELISNRKYSSLFKKLDNKIYYFDFDSRFSFENFNNDYILNKYDKSLLIIDNLHRESEDQFIQIINLIMQAKNKAYGIFIVFRKPEEFLINQTKAINLYNSISKHCIEIACTKKAVEEINNSNILPSGKVEFQSFLNSIGFNDLEFENQSIVFLHLYKVYLYYTKFLNKKIFDIFYVLQGTKKNEVIMDALITIFILCQNIGKFESNDFYYIMKNLNHNHHITKTILKTLLTTNFIERGGYDRKSKYYFFHEELANTYLKYLLNQEIMDKVIKISEILYKQQYKKNEVLSWQYSIICRSSIKYDPIIFDKVLCTTNKKNMFILMRYYWGFIEHKDYTLYREYGILNSIIGNDDSAHEYFIKSYKMYPKPETLLELFEVKHKYYLMYEEDIKKKYNDSNPYVKLGISYWDKHINMHLGKFDFNSYPINTNLIVDNLDWINEHEPYESKHILKRWYFDYFKFFFLSGELDFDKINFQKDSALYKIKNVLKKSMNEFMYYNQVYVYADYIQYVILFKSRIDKSFYKKEELNFVGIHGNETYVTDQYLTNYALNLYDNTIQIMKKNGDHSYHHVLNRKIDLLLQKDQCDFNEIEILLEHYMQYSFEINCFEYVAYANMFLLKSKLISQIILSNEKDRTNEIKQHIKNFRYYYQKHNNFHKNIYAHMRLSLFEALFNYQTDHKSSIKLKNQLEIILDFCQDNNYFREQRLIRWIAERNYRLSPAELKYFYQSYPIIIQ